MCAGGRGRLHSVCILRADKGPAAAPPSPPSGEPQLWLWRRAGLGHSAPVVSFRDIQGRERRVAGSWSSLVPQFPLPWGYSCGKVINPMNGVVEERPPFPGALAKQRLHSQHELLCLLAESLLWPYPGCPVHRLQMGPWGRLSSQHNRERARAGLQGGRADSTGDSAHSTPRPPCPLATFPSPVPQTQAGSPFSALFLGAGLSLPILRAEGRKRN